LRESSHKDQKIRRDSEREREKQEGGKTGRFWGVGKKSSRLPVFLFSLSP
jgi:hypothetical protein